MTERLLWGGALDGDISLTAYAEALDDDITLTAYAETCRTYIAATYAEARSTTSRR